MLYYILSTSDEEQGVLKHKYKECNTVYLYAYKFYMYYKNKIPNITSYIYILYLHLVIKVYGMKSFFPP